LGSMPYVVKNALEYFPAATLHPGDGILLNDSFLGAGHFPDHFLISPAFDRDQLIGYTVNCGHKIDVGGAAPGSQLVTGVTEAFQEGLRILPIRIFREGEIDKDLERLILGNVRVPDAYIGDLIAQRNSNFLGAQRLQRLFQASGLEVIDAAVEAILDRSEEMVRRAIRRIPDGRYEFEDYFDDSGTGTEPIVVHVAVEVKGDEIVVDFTGSSQEVAAGMNSYINYTRAYAMFSIKVFTEPLLAQNEGVIRPIQVIAEPGSFFNPRFPAPSGGRATVQIRIFDAINGALSAVLPDRVMGAFSHWSNPNLGGVDGNGKRFVMYDLIYGGYGGKCDGDGAEALSPVLNARNIPVEVHETNNPILVRRFEMIRDSGGAGKFRGGCGIRKEVELRAPSAVLTTLCDRHVFPPYGLFGGAPGVCATSEIDNVDGTSTSIGSKCVSTVTQGQTIRLCTAGAGGYGDPFERDPKAVSTDVLDDYVSVEAARERYGVVIDPATCEIDHVGTQRMRASRLAAGVER